MHIGASSQLSSITLHLILSEQLIIYKILE